MGFADSLELIKVIQEKGKSWIWAEIPLKPLSQLLPSPRPAAAPAFPEAAKERGISGNIFSHGTCPWRGKVGFDSRQDSGADGAPWLLTGLGGEA